jgi:hypothetical protein
VPKVHQLGVSAVEFLLFFRREASFWTLRHLNRRAASHQSQGFAQIPFFSNGCSDRFGRTS